MAMSATRVAGGAPALAKVTGVPGSSTGYWATPQPHTTAATPSAAMTRVRAADPGYDHQRQCPAGEPGVESWAGGVQFGQGREGQGPGHDGGGLGAVGEVGLQAPVAAAGGLAGQVDGGQVPAGGDEQEPGQHSGGAGPGGQAGVAGDGGDGPGGDGADHGAHEERGHQGGEGEGGAGGALGRQPGQFLAEGEAGAAEHDPGQRQPQRQGEGGHHRGERVGERGPEDDQVEDQPDVVGLPHGGDRLVDQGPRRPAPRGGAGQQIPQAAAEVGPAQHRVQGDPGEQDASHHVRGHQYPPSPAARSCGAGLGP